MVIAGDVVGDAGEDRISAPVWAAETVIRPSLPENMPFLSDLVFEST
jgi:hypothetical protein